MISKSYINKGKLGRPYQYSNVEIFAVFAPFFHMKDQ